MCPTTHSTPSITQDCRSDLDLPRPPSLHFLPDRKDYLLPPNDRKLPSVLVNPLNPFQLITPTSHLGSRVVSSDRECRSVNLGPFERKSFSL